MVHPFADEYARESRRVLACSDTGTCDKVVKLRHTDHPDLMHLSVGSWWSCCDSGDVPIFSALAAMVGALTSLHTRAMLLFASLRHIIFSDRVAFVSFFCSKNINFLLCVCMCVARLAEVGSEAVPPKKEHQAQESWIILAYLSIFAFRQSSRSRWEHLQPWAVHAWEVQKISPLLGCSDTAFYQGLRPRPSAKNTWKHMETHGNTWKHMEKTYAYFWNSWIAHFLLFMWETCPRQMAVSVSSHNALLTQRGRGSQKVTLPDLLFRMSAHWCKP